MADSDKIIVWLDIDNTLYPASARISQAMSVRIHDYFVSMGLSHEEASSLHMKYYSQYGLALRGLVKHHQIDPLDFDRRCDGSLPLEDMIRPDPKVRKLLEDIDRSKARVWALTNAYRTHAERVLRILKLEDLIEGIVYCDYEQEDFFCKPEPRFYDDALYKVNVTDASRCFFVDDNRSNVVSAKKLGWGSCVYFCESGVEVAHGGAVKLVEKEVEAERAALSRTGKDVDAVIDDLDNLRYIWTEIFHKIS